MTRLTLKPKWVYVIAALAAAAPAVALLLHVAGLLPHSLRNLVPFTAVAGALVIGLLYLSLELEFPEYTRPLPGWMGILILTGLAAGLVALKVRHYAELLNLPHDLGGWPDQLFIMDITKWLTGSPLYLPATESTSAQYSPGAPALSFAIARLFGRAESIPFYRWIQQAYLLIGAGFGVTATGNLGRLWRGESGSRFLWRWAPFFFLTLYLMSLNPQTAAFNIYLHNDPLAFTCSLAAFWVATLHSRRQHSWLLIVMALIPAIGFHVKQYLAIWAVAFAVYLWLDGRTPLPRLLAFCAGAFGALLIGVGGVAWLAGPDYRYWIFEALGAETVFYRRLIDRFTDASLYVLPGLVPLFFAGRGEERRRILALWSVWVVLFWGGFYTSGITYSPTHLGPATMVGMCFLLAGLAAAWPGTARDGAGSHRPLQAGAAVIVLIFLFSAFGFSALGGLHRTPDYDRYVSEIEKEFEGLPPASVLIDHGEWVYLRHRVVQRDRWSSIVVPRDRSTRIYERLRQRVYARVLVHEIAPGIILYDIGGSRGIGEVLLQNYREVRRIKGVVGMKNWRYAGQALSDIVVLEPRP